MRITIIGIGAMGSLFGGRLAHLAEISMLGSWQPQIDVLNSKGITLIHPDGRTTNHFVKAANDPAVLEPADVVLVLVKAPKTAAAAKLAVQILNPDGLVITLQNGLGNLETIAEIVGPERAAQGVTSEGALMVEPGVVRHAGAGQTYLAKSMVGNREGGPARTVVLEQVANLFYRTGFETELVENADSLIWGKLAVNAGINPLTALLQVPNGYLIESNDGRWLMHQTALEVSAVAKALDITLPYRDAAKRAEQVAWATAANLSSMAQDVARGVPTEIDAICGAVVNYGRQAGVQTPFNEAMLHLIQRQTTTGDWQDELDSLPRKIRLPFIRLTARKSIK